ncbi:YetF domain-containing protein [Vallitalea okinawensis]|uniref:YetF domain-containing protein n=1 Tax=Vallitalea okinawensis TaxID=2078660 RepID=UPI000CFD387C
MTRNLNLPITLREYLPSEIIVDGRVVSKNLREFNLSEEWLECQLRLYGIESKEKVIYAELQSDGSLYVNKK